MVATFRKGSSGTPSAAQAMGEHLSEQTLPEEMVAMADYYLRGVARAEAEGTAALPRQDMAPEVAAALGLDMNRTATQAEVVNLLRGLRTDGETIANKPGYTPGPGRDRITYYDFTFSAPKSVSVAMALAPTEAERYVIAGAHREAAQDAMEHLETIIGRARKGHAGSKGSVQGKIAWVSFDHYTARPTIHIPHTEDDGTRSTLIATVRNPKVAGDMDLHTHFATPNAVFCDDGSVGSLDSLALHERVLEVGGYYHARLATILRGAGIETARDERTDLLTLAAVPQAINDMFSKRSRDGEAAARSYAATQGVDWDGLAAMEKAKLVKGGTRASRRQKETGNRGDDMSDVEAWKAEAAAVGYEHRTVIDQARRNPLPTTQHDMRMRGYLASLSVLDKDMGRRATMNASMARRAATRGMIVGGAESPADISAITAMMREHGVLHDGELVPLVWATAPVEAEGRRPGVKITTTKHIAQECEAMALAAAAAADRTGSLSTGQIDRAVRIVSERDGLDFTTEHGKRQREVIGTIGTAGRLAVAVGIAGSGKTTLLKPLVEAWQAATEIAGDERVVWGTALATRRADALKEAGIASRNVMPVSALIGRARKGEIALDERSVVVVDEMGLIGTAHTLALLKLRAEHGFAIVAIGDDRQGQAIEAGSTIKLMRKALGVNALPELNSSVRQLRERDRETAGMFRVGNAEGAIARLREDGHAILVPGGHRHAVEATADLWAERHAANTGREGYTLGVSAPTNGDARAIGAAIRLRRRAAGAVGPDKVTVAAADQIGAEYELPLAVGDRVRLFAGTSASFGGRGGSIGHNGSVLEVERIDAGGLQLLNKQGRSGFVQWDTLRDKETGRIRLTYGDALTVDAMQGDTFTDSIHSLPSGSAAENAFKAYPAQSRSRETTLLVVGDGLERAEIDSRRALGSGLPAITEANVWANVARNLSRDPEKELAVDLLERANEVHTGTVRSLARAFQPAQQREAEGQPRTTLHETFAARRDAEDVARAAPDLRREAARSAAAAAGTVLRLTGPNADEIRKAVRDARRATRIASQRPKQQRKPSMPAMPRTDIEAEFRDALHRAGLRFGPRDGLQMDGEKHYLGVDGSKSRRGFYVGHLDGAVPAGTIINHKTGQRIDWVASGPRVEMTEADRAAERQRQAAGKLARERAHQKVELRAAGKAAGMWNRASPASPTHPYLVRKGVSGRGLRQNQRGALLVAMRDVAGKIWSLQTINAAGGKLYMKDARKQGTFALLGDLDDDGPLIVVEGFATGDTMRLATGFPVAVALDSSNLLEVSRALREAYPERAIVVAADNDHHLPRRPVPLPNIGIVKGTAAAEAVGGKLLAPVFAPTEAGKDWNDYSAQHGLAAVRAAADQVMGVTQSSRDAARRHVQQAAETAADAARRQAQRPRQGPVL